MNKSIQIKDISTLRLNRNILTDLVRTNTHSLFKEDCEIVWEGIVSEKVNIDMILQTTSGKFIAVKVVDDSDLTNGRKLIDLYDQLMKEFKNELTLYVIRTGQNLPVIEHRKIRSIGIVFTATLVSA